MSEILFVIVMVFCLIAGFFVFIAGADECHGYTVFTGLGMVLFGLILLAYYIKTPLPEYKLKSSYDLFDGKTFIGCKTDEGLVNITLATGRSDITIDGYKWDEYESSGQSGVINWGIRTRWELSSKGAE